MRGLDDDDNDVLGDLPPTLTFDNLDTLRSSRKQALGEAAKRRRKVVSEDGEAVDEEDARSRVVGGEDDNHNHLGGKEEEKKGDKKEEPKAKRVRREVAKLDADRLLSPSGLDALVGIAKNIKLKGKRHEFEDLQQIMFQYQKWGHQVFPKVVFRSFLETTEKICRERRVKVWRDTLIRKERRHAMGLLSDDEEIGVEKMETDVQLIDAAAPQNGRSIDEALDLMDSLDAAEEDELLRLAAALDPLPVAAKAALQAPSPPARLSVMQDDEEDFDFEAEMMLQLSELPVRPSIREELGNLEPERKSVKAVMSSLTSVSGRC
ncbi:replication fork protection component Swi3-domain-containing protein [Chytriomyces sp. MP71]|nr:replication fork protection component Swi3-domain-containing protein [Chytriomyces sp. MP71]